MYLKSATKSIHQDGEEEKSASLIETSRVRLQVVEDTANDQSHNSITEELSERKRWITAKALEATPQTELDLLYVGQCVWRFHASVFLLGI
jgi:hypothetical protein